MTFCIVPPVFQAQATEAVAPRPCASASPRKRRNAAGTAGPHGMNEKNLDDLPLLSQRRSTSYRGRTDMRLEEHFESSSTLQRNERVKLAASFWNNVGAGMVIGGMAGAFFLDKPPGAWTKIGIAIAGLALGWLCYSIASNMLTYLHTAPESAARAVGTTDKAG